MLPSRVLLLLVALLVVPGSVSGQWEGPSRLLDSGMIVSVRAIERGLRPQNAMFPAAVGKQYVAAYVQLYVPEGLAVKPQPWSYQEFGARTSAGTVEPALALAEVEGICPRCLLRDEHLPLEGILAAGSFTSGWVTFEVPEDTGPIDVLFRGEDWTDVPSVEASGLVPDPTPEPTPSPSPTPVPTPALDPVELSGPAGHLLDDFVSEPFWLAEGEYVIEHGIEEVLDRFTCSIYAYLRPEGRTAWLVHVEDHAGSGPVKRGTSDPHHVEAGSYEVRVASTCDWSIAIRRLD